MERAPESAPAPAATCIAAATDALLPEALRYVDDARPGYTRRRLRGHFVYFDTRGERIRARRQCSVCAREPLV